VPTRAWGSALVLTFSCGKPAKPGLGFVLVIPLHMTALPPALVAVTLHWKFLGFSRSSGVVVYSFEVAAVVTGVPTGSLSRNHS
jgi:hypothetical protein